MTENKVERVLRCHLSLSQSSVPEVIQEMEPVFLKLLGDGERSSVGEVDNYVFKKLNLKQLNKQQNL